MTRSAEDSRAGRVAHAVAVALTVLVAHGRVARADEASTQAAAQGLFNDGKVRMAAGDYAAACPEFEESQRLVRGIGVTLYLAECYEKQGRTASAWAQFEVAESLATQQHDDRADIARARVARLEPQLAKLTVTMAPGADVPELVVEQDDIPFGRPRWGVAIPVDPGVHRIHAIAPGKMPWTSKVEVPPAGSVSIVIPPLADAQVAPVASPPPVVAAPASKAQRAPLPSTSRRVGPLAWAGFGIAGAGAVLGSVTGAVALAKANDVKASCGRSLSCGQTGIGSEISESTALGDVSTVSFIVAGAGLATAVVAMLLPSRPASEPVVHAWVLPGSAGVAGTF